MPIPTAFLGPLSPASAHWASLASGLNMIAFQEAGPALHPRPNRPAKRNCIGNTWLAQVQTVLVKMPQRARAWVPSGEGNRLCAGLRALALAEKVANIAEGGEAAKLCIRDCLEKCAGKAQKQ